MPTQDGWHDEPAHTGAPAPVVLMLFGGWVGLAALALRAVRRARAELARAEVRSTAQALLFALSVAALLLHVVSDQLVGAGLVVCWGLLALLARLARVLTLFHPRSTGREARSLA